MAETGRPRALGLIEWLRFQGLTENEARILAEADAVILEVLRDAKVAEKHPDGDWLKEDADQHLLAAAGHALRAAREGFGFKNPDGEDHLARALTRCAEAAAVRRATRHERLTG
jgi:hypothetical protein